MKHLLIIFLSLLCITSCKKKNNYDSTFAVITKQPYTAGPDSARLRGAIISMDPVYLMEKGFIWYSLTPPVPPAKLFKNRTTMGGGSSQPGDFWATISYQSSVQDSFLVKAYAISSKGDSLSGVSIKFRNY